MTETCQKALARRRGTALRRGQRAKKRAPLGEGARAGTLRIEVRRRRGCGGTALLLRFAKRRPRRDRRCGRRRRAHRQPAGRRRRLRVVRVESLEERGESRLLRVVNTPLVLGRTCERSIIGCGHKHSPGARSNLDRASDVPRLCHSAGPAQLGVFHRVSASPPEMSPTAEPLRTDNPCQVSYRYESARRVHPHHFARFPQQ